MVPGEGCMSPGEGCMVPGRAALRTCPFPPPENLASRGSLALGLAVAMFQLDEARHSSAKKQ